MPFGDAHLNFIGASSETSSAAGGFEKTTLCRFHLWGRCVHGSACKFAHGKHELRTKPDLHRTRLCRYLVNGACKYGAGCAYAHAVSDLRRPRHHISQSPTSSASPRATALGAQKGLEVPAEVVKSLVLVLEAAQEVLSLAHLHIGDAGSTGGKGAVARRPHLGGGAACGGVTREELRRLLETSSRLAEELQAWVSDMLPTTDAGAASRVVALEADRDEAVACELLVRRTFLTLAPVGTGAALRRSTSAPALR